MKKILSIAIILMLLSLCGCSSNEEFPKPTENFYVNDFADVIEDSVESEMLSRAVSLNQQTTAQVVVVTVESLNGREPWEYALELGRQWGVGDEEKDNGVVILLSESERQIYIAVGYGLEGALPDSKTGRIIDIYGLEYLRNDDFSNGLLAISKAVVNETYAEYGIAAENDYVPIDSISMSQNSSSQEGEGGKVVVSWIVMIVFIAVYLLLYKKFGVGVFLLGGGPRYRGGGFSGGGFKGGGGFSGGGGSFGGGGAGRGF